jgi:hypothetical protein
MPFVPWTVVRQRAVDPAIWKEVVADHQAMISRFEELGTELVIGSRAVEDAGRRLNQGFVWTRSTGVQSGRSKDYLPDAEDGWEATWFRRPPSMAARGVIDGYRVRVLRRIRQPTLVRQRRLRRAKLDHLSRSDVLAETTADRNLPAV